MRYIKVILLSVFVSPALAQSVSEWNPGSVVLTDNQVLVGDIMLHLDFNTLLLKESNQVTVFPAQKVHSFRFYDATNNINRQFLTLSIQRNENVFYELVLQGSYKIIRKQKRVHAQLADDKLDYEYFIMCREKIVPIESFKRNVFPILISTHPPLREWVESEHLNLNTPEAAILIIREYNKHEAMSLVASR